MDSDCRWSQCTLASMLACRIVLVQHPPPRRRARSQYHGPPVAVATGKPQLLSDPCYFLVSSAYRVLVRGSSSFLRP